MGRVCSGTVVGVSSAEGCGGKIVDGGSLALSFGKRRRNAVISVDLRKNIFSKSYIFAIWSSSSHFLAQSSSLQRKTSALSDEALLDFDCAHPLCVDALFSTRILPHFPFSLPTSLLAPDLISETAYIDQSSTSCFSSR
jgi:hypothetical protein